MRVPLRSAANVTGLVLSGVCVVHCMALPLCLSSLGTSEFGWLANPLFHQVLAVFGVLLGLWALLPGWRAHRRHSVLAFAAVGLAVMNYDAFAGGECCVEPVVAAEPEASSACGSSCCSSKPVAEPPQSGAAEASVVASAMLPPVAWLSQHPTVLGATLLFLAHLLNGRCGCTGCRLPADEDRD